MCTGPRPFADYIYASGPAKVSKSEMRPEASISPASFTSSVLPLRNYVSARKRKVVFLASTASTRTLNVSGSAKKRSNIAAIAA